MVQGNKHLIFETDINNGIIKIKNSDICDSESIYMLFINMMRY